MSLFHIVLGLVVLQRLGELAVAARNTRDLRAAGAIELDAGGYPLFVLLHAAWLVSLAVLVPASTAPSWPLLAVFAALQLGRLWVIASLGRYWTTRIIVPPDRPPVSHGPYRFFRHPNYLIVVAEIAILPLAFGAIGIATVFSAANLALLARRVMIEERALAPRRPVGAQSP
jgi:methyltransferase